MVFPPIYELYSGPLLSLLGYFVHQYFEYQVKLARLVFLMINYGGEMIWKLQIHSQNTKINMFIFNCQENNHANRFLSDGVH